MVRVWIVAAVLGLVSVEARACDPTAEEAVVNELFNSRAPLSPEKSQEVMDRFVPAGEKIEKAIKAGDIDGACAMIADLKQYISSLPAK